MLSASNFDLRRPAVNPAVGHSRGMRAVASPLVLVAALLWSSTVAAQTPPPNIVFIILDDVAVDQLASYGMRCLGLRPSLLRDLRQRQLWDGRSMVRLSDARHERLLHPVRHQEHALCLWRRCRGGVIWLAVCEHPSVGREPQRPEPWLGGCTDRLFGRCDDEPVRRPLLAQPLVAPGQRASGWQDISASYSLYRPQQSLSHG